MIVRVRCQRDRGFLRAGRHWPGGESEFNTAAWPEADRARLEDLLLAEHGRLLHVEIVEGGPASEAARKAHAASRAPRKAAARSERQE